MACTVCRPELVLAVAPLFSRGTPQPPHVTHLVTIKYVNLSPASAMFREGSSLLYKEPELGDAALYHAVLAAICSGSRKRFPAARG